MITQTFKPMIPARESRLRSWWQLNPPGNPGCPWSPGRWTIMFNGKSMETYKMYENIIHVQWKKINYSMARGTVLMVIYQRGPFFCDTVDRWEIQRRWRPRNLQLVQDFSTMHCIYVMFPKQKSGPYIFVRLHRKAIATFLGHDWILFWGPGVGY